MAFSPGFISRLGELPIVKARTEVGGDRLVFLCPLVVTEAVIGETERLGQHPTLSIILLEEGADAGVSITSILADHLFKIVQGNERQDGLTVLGMNVFVDAPKAFGKQLASEFLSACIC